MSHLSINYSKCSVHVKCTFVHIQNFTDESVSKNSAGKDSRPGVLMVTAVCEWRWWQQRPNSGYEMAMYIVSHEIWPSARKMRGWVTDTTNLNLSSGAQNRIPFLSPSMIYTYCSLLYTSYNLSQTDQSTIDRIHSFRQTNHVEENSSNGRP